MITKEKLKNLYWNKNMTYKEIANHFKLPNILGWVEEKQ